MPQEIRIIKNKINDQGEIIRLDFGKPKKKLLAKKNKDYKGFSFCQLMEEAQLLLQTITHGDVSQPIRIKTLTLITELKRRITL